MIGAWYHFCPDCPDGQPLTGDVPIQVSAEALRGSVHVGQLDLPNGVPTVLKFVWLEVPIGPYGPGDASHLCEVLFDPLDEVLVFVPGLGVRVRCSVG